MDRGDSIHPAHGYTELHNTPSQALGTTELQFPFY